MTCWVVLLLQQSLDEQFVAVYVFLHISIILTMVMAYDMNPFRSKTNQLWYNSNRTTVNNCNLKADKNKIKILHFEIMFINWSKGALNISRWIRTAIWACEL